MEPRHHSWASEHCRSHSEDRGFKRVYVSVNSARNELRSLDSKFPGAWAAREIYECRWHDDPELGMTAVPHWHIGSVRENGGWKDKLSVFRNRASRPRSRAAPSPPTRPAGETRPESYREWTAEEDILLADGHPKVYFRAQFPDRGNGQMRTRRRQLAEAEREDWS